MDNYFGKTMGKKINPLLHPYVLFTHFIIIQQWHIIIFLSSKNNVQYTNENYLIANEWNHAICQTCHSCSYMTSVIIIFLRWACKCRPERVQPHTPCRNSVCECFLQVSIEFSVHKRIVLLSKLFKIMPKAYFTKKDLYYQMRSV